jgi:thioesterase domain-containing protein
VADHLRQQGRRVVVPALAADSPPYHRKFAESVGRAVADSGPVVLIGHSGAGALLPEIAAVLDAQVAAAVFVDAVLPRPEASWFDTAPAELREHLAGLARDGRLPPWHEWFPPGAVESLLPGRELRERFVAELPRLPVAYFQEPAPATRLDIDCAYVRLSAPYDGAADEAERLGWWVRRLDADHLAMLTQPEQIADAVTEAASVRRRRTRCPPDPA